MAEVRRGVHAAQSTLGGAIEEEDLVLEGEVMGRIGLFSRCCCDRSVVVATTACGEEGAEEDSSV